LYSYRLLGVVVMPNVTLAILGGLAIVVLAMLALWRGSRRAAEIGYLKGATVSRQWLMQHQSEDRS